MNAFTQSRAAPSPGDPKHSEEPKNTQIVFVRELLLLTGKLLELKHMDFTYMSSLFRVIITLINIYRAKEPKELESHWSFRLREGCTVQDHSMYEKLLLACLHVMKISSVLQLDQQVMDSVKYLGLAMRHRRQPDANEFLRTLLSKIESRRTGGQSKVNQISQGMVKVYGLNQVIPVQSEQVNNYNLDIILLNLLFYSGTNKIKKLCLGLIIGHFEQKENILNYLDEVSLFGPGPDRTVYEDIVRYQKKISHHLKLIKFLADTSLGNGVKLRESQEFQSHRMHLESLLKALKKYILGSSIEQIMRIQSTLKSLWLHMDLIELLVREWPWTRTTRTHIIAVDPLMLEVYSLVTSVLIFFCQHNSRNKFLLLPYLKSFIVLIENQIGISKLIAEVLQCERDNKFTKIIVSEIFSQIEKRDSLAENQNDLYMLFELVLDENGRIYPESQANVTKALMNYPRLVEKIKMAFAETANVAKEEEKFWASMLRLLNILSIKLAFSTLQCRQLVPHQILLRELRTGNMPFRLKKQYLHAMYFIHFMRSEGILNSVSLPVIEELLYRVVLPDIELYTQYVKHLEFICKKDLYKVCLVMDRLQVAQTKGAGAARGMVLSLIAGKQEDTQQVKQIHLETLSYFKYLSTSIPMKKQYCTGLLAFVKDISRELRLYEELPEGLLRALACIKLELQFMYNEIHDAVQNSMKTVDFHGLLDEILGALIEIPDEICEDQRKAECEESYELLLEQLRDYIEFNGKHIDDFLQLIEFDDNSNVSKLKFITIIKQLLQQNIDINRIYKATEVIPKELDSLHLEGMVQSLRDGLSTGPFTHISPDHSTGSAATSEVDLRSGLKEFAQSLRHEMADEPDSELKSLVKTMKENIFDTELDKKESSLLRTFFYNIEQAFSKGEHKIHLLNIFIYMIKLEENPNKEQQNDRVKRLVLLYADIGMIEMALSSLNKQTRLPLAKTSLTLLITILKANSRTTIVKSKILETLRGNLSQAVFVFFQYNIRDTSETILNIHQEMKKIKKKRSLSNEEYTVSRDKLNSILFTTEILLFLQLCCDNCYSSFQDYLREQETSTSQASINLVDEVGYFIINLPKLSELKTSIVSNEITDIVTQCLKTLTDMCQGPCPQNQALLGLSNGIYKFLKWILTNNSYSFENKCPWFGILSESIKFMKSLVEACTNLQIPQIMYTEIKENTLYEHAVCIWKNLVVGREEMVFQENKGKPIKLLKLCQATAKPFNDFEQNIIETGFNIYTLLLYINNLSKSYQRTSQITNIIQQSGSVPVENAIQKQMKTVEILNEQDTMYKSLKSLYRRFIKHFSNDLGGGAPAEPDKVRASRFYASCTATVELNKDGILSFLHFRIPPMFKYLTNKSSTELKNKIYKITHHERIEALVARSDRYEKEMAYQQQLAKYPLIDSIASKWRSYSNASFTIVLVLNLFILFDISHEGEDSRTGPWKFSNDMNFIVFVVLAIIQTIFALLLYVSYIVEYYPVLIYKRVNASRAAQLKKYDKAKYARIKGTVLLNQVMMKTRQSISKPGLSLVSILFYVITDIQCIYNLIYLLVSVLSVFWVLFYPILLLDIVIRSRTLINVLKSVSLNWNQLILTLVLGIVIMYVFAMMAFLWFPEDYPHGSDAEIVTYCDSLFLCLISTSGTGVRAGGGLGEWLEQRKISDSFYVARSVFDLLYFIVITIVILNIVFGIIIDTFAQLRDERNLKEKIVKELCYICGNNKFQFELRRLGWKYHVEIEHNVTAYLALLVYVKHKNIQECNGLEKYVKEQMDAANFDFFPTTSMSLLQFDQVKHIS